MICHIKTGCPNTSCQTATTVIVNWPAIRARKTSNKWLNVKAYIIE